MHRYIVRLFCDSWVRLNDKPYFGDKPAPSIAIDLPGVTVAVFDGSAALGDMHLPKGLIVQVALEAADIDMAIESGRGQGPRV